MTEQAQNEKSHQIAAEWFAQHRATLIESNDELTIIEWRRIDTANYAMRYIITCGCVIVIGDVGDAIYGFGRQQTLEMLASYDWHYFINKCVSSETGRQYTMKMPGIKYPVPNVRAIGHFVGLQMAIKQLQK